MPQGFRTPLCLASIAIALAYSTGCAGPGANELISYERALEISRAAATKQGYDLSKYSLDTFGDSKGAGEGIWLIGYKCQPDPPPPDCGFLVVVDRKSGEAKVMSGA
jgi:hypothetical protein